MRFLLAITMLFLIAIWLLRGIRQWSDDERRLVHHTKTVDQFRDSWRDLENVDSV